jgi:hypothetical protein
MKKEATAEKRITSIDRGYYLPPPKVGDLFEGPWGPDRAGLKQVPYVYEVAAIVDLGFFSNDPTYYQVVFRYKAKHKGNKVCWEIKGADAIDLGLYTPMRTKKPRRASRRG